MTWKEAQTFCRNHHTDLATIRSKQENSAIRSFDGWIGLYHKNQKNGWKWSRGDRNATFFDWVVDDPDNGNHFCGYKTKYKPQDEGKWRDWECNKKYIVICYDEYLVLVKENKTWEEALEHCRALDSVNRFNLATLLTEHDLSYAQELAQNATTDEIWTGLRYLGDEWFWVGGESMLDAQNPGRCPVNRCGVLDKNGTSFRTGDCSQKRNFFCYY
ncbi:putative C-type lectin domain family 20 member A [Cyprinodon tularosa]|uniref:putative C-type lectin domain family 20 member A n=1 Tax=Cyprinodon tularosa TaxID=77115 RepID=UPI0018E1F2C1|nr:putative C-type lectin domain family 20 member A [Cyprinodon tularosa]